MLDQPTTASSVKRVRSPARLARALAAGLASTLLIVGAAEAGPAAAWRDAYQSSPAFYEPVPESLIQAAANQMKLDPARIRARMAAKAIGGTIRYRVTVGAAGSKLRIRLSNEEGSTPLQISAASVALATDGFSMGKGALKPLLFSGVSSLTVPSGAPAVSDPVDLPVKSGDALIVTVAVTSPVLADPRSGGTFLVAAGDQTKNETLQEPQTVSGRPLLTGVSVLTKRPPRVIVAMGDSITDGSRSTPDALHGWPEVLSRRLGEKSPGAYALLNAGIGGNRLLTPGWGAAGLARLDRDVLRVDGVTHLILLEGINDIGMSGKGVFGEGPMVTAADLIAGYRQVIARAHLKGVKVIIATLPPTKGSVTHASPEKEAVREGVNQWIRTSHEPDAVIDFDRTVQDPADPTRLRAVFDSGDHLHPSDDGYRAMGAAIDLALFQ